MALCHGIILPHLLRGQEGETERGRGERKTRTKKRTSTYSRSIVIAHQQIEEVVKRRMESGYKTGELCLEGVTKRKQLEGKGMTQLHRQLGQGAILRQNPN